jgi:hypothetical protein
MTAIVTKPGHRKGSSPTRRRKRKQSNWRDVGYLDATETIS